MQTVRATASHRMFSFTSSPGETMRVVKERALMAQVKIVLVKDDNELRD